MENAPGPAPRVAVLVAGASSRRCGFSLPSAYSITHHMSCRGSKRAAMEIATGLESASHGASRAWTPYVTMGASARRVVDRTLPAQSSARWVEAMR
jgi:hypothetical protein